MAERAGSSTGEKRKSESSAQKVKYYKFQGDPRGGRGRGGGGRGRGRGGRGGRGGSGGGGRDRGERRERQEQPKEEDEVPKKKSSMGRYRTAPLPEMLTSPGICVTTWKDKERSAEGELIDLLEQITDELYPETIEDLVKAEAEGEGEGDDLDFEELLKKDLESMKSENKSKRFQLCSFAVMCVIYVNVLPPLSPHVLVRRILEQAESNGRSPLKYCKRLIPISATCGATVHQLAEAAKGVAEEEFKTDDGKALKFAIDTNTRQSDRLQRLEMITTVAEQVTKLDQGHSVDLKNPDKTILLELYKNTVGLTVVDDYERFKKYNISQVASHVAQSRSQSAQPSSSRITLPAAPATNDNITSDLISEAAAAPITEGPDAVGDQEPITTAAATHTSTPKHVYRERRAEHIAQLSNTSPAKNNIPQGEKKQAPAQEDGQVDEIAATGAAEAEAGQVLENPSEELKDGWVERIEDGEIVRVRENESEL